MITLATLRTFLAVVEAGSLQEGARRLGLAQPTVTQQLQKLEAEIGTRLLHRHRNGCRTTRQGAALLPIARAMLRLAERARAVGAEERLALGASHNIATYFLPPVLRRFAETRPEARLDLMTGSNPEILERLESGEIDLALSEWWDERPGFAAEAWRREPLVVIVPPGHAWARRRSLPASALAGQPLIGGEPGSGTATLLRQALGPESGIETVMTVGSTEAVKRAVAAGLGVSVALAGAVADAVDAGRLSAVALAGDGLAKTFYAVHPEDLGGQAGAIDALERLLRAA